MNASSFGKNVTWPAAGRGAYWFWTVHFPKQLAIGIPIPSLKRTAKAPENGWLEVRRLVSVLDGFLAGAMLVSGSVSFGDVGVSESSLILAE